MNPIFLLIRTYWAPMLAITLCLSIVGYVGYQRHEINGLKRDKIALQQTIDLAKAVGLAQNEKTARIEQGAHAAVTLQAQQGQSDLIKIKAYYEAHPIAKSNAANRVCKSTADTSGSQLSSVPITSKESADSGENVDSTTGGQSIEQSCAITTQQYNILHQAWDDACKVLPCK